MFGQVPAGGPPTGGPITIEQAVAEGLDHNLSLLAERFNVTVAAAAVVTAGLRPNPVVTVNVMRPDAPLVDTGIAVNEGGGTYRLRRRARRQARAPDRAGEAGAVGGRTAAAGHDA